MVMIMVDEIMEQWLSDLERMVSRDDEDMARLYDTIARRIDESPDRDKMTDLLEKIWQILVYLRPE